MAGDTTGLRNRPFSDQIAAIDAAIAAGDGPALVAELAGYRDHQPLAHALGALSRLDQLDAIAGDAARRAIALPDTSLRRVLRALENTPVPEQFARSLAAAAGELGVDRVAAAAMVDRWLKNVAPAVRAPMVDGAVRHCVELLDAARPDDVRDAALFRVPGTAFAELDDRAAASGVSEAWAARVERFADAVLDSLEAQPKSLSQANAEELLSRQVYTDPGHFLIELLQNADDARATVWRVRVEPDRVEIEHDGVPFDARDVVGILSIGQTTKSKEQIGFFGVGFKSVYDICERPQVYSGPFSFEIANVSVPRPLAAHPTRGPGQTLLVLPLRDPGDADRSPNRLFERLATLPGEVLLTLNSLQEIDVRFGDRHHRVTTTAGDDGRVTLREQERTRRFLVEQTEARYDRARDANRAQATPLLLAIALDDDGRPQPIGERPTVYSFLPTGERSGLRFAIHAHFDLPVDRERLDLSSKWNEWAIGRVAPLLCRAVGRLVDEWRSANGDALAASRLDAVVDVLSLPAEVGAHAYRAILDGLGDVAFLPGAGGDRLAATTSLIAGDPRLVRALAGVVLPDGKRVLRGLDPRAADVARTLGAIALELPAVVALLVDDAAGRTAGAAFDPPWASSMVELAAVLSGATVDVAPLRDVACLPDTAGLARAPGDLMRAGGELRALLGSLRPLVHESLQVAECAPLLDRLGVGRATTRDLVALLADPAMARAVIDAAGIDRVLAHLANAQPTELDGAEQAALAMTDAGELRPIGDAFLTGDSQLADLVRGAARHPPLVARDLEQRCARALSLLGSPRLDLRTAIELIGRGDLRVAGEHIGELHRAIDAQRDAISPALGAHIARAPIFPRDGGGLAPLVGDGRAEIPADDDIRLIWPDHPWLTAEVAGLGYVRALGVEPIGAGAVARELLRAAPDDARRRAAFGYLAAHREALGSEVVAALANAALWPDVDGTLRPLDDLRRPSQHPAVARLYELWPRAMTVEPGDGAGTVMHLAAALDIAHHVVAPDLATAIDDLAGDAADLDLDAPALDEAVRAVLLAAAVDLPRARLERVRAAPIFACADGARRGLGSWSEPDADRGHRCAPRLRAAFASGRYPLLAEGTTRELSALLDALALRPGGAADLVRAVDGEVGQLDAATASILRGALVASRAEIDTADAELAERLSTLAIWPTTRGLVGARSALRRDALEPLIRARVDDWAPLFDDGDLALLAPAAEADAAHLADVIGFADEVAAVRDALGRSAVEDAPLAEQVAALSTPDRIGAIAAALVSRVDEPWSLPIAVNAEGLLVARRPLVASPEELAFAAGLPIHARLADAVWASVVEAGVPGALEAVGVRHIIVDLYEVSRDAIAPEQHPCLFDPGRRAGLNAWLLARTAEIEGDEQARGALGKTCFVLSANGVLRAPRELLFDAALPELGIDWNPAPEVPAALCAWLRDTYRPAAKQLRPLIDHMMDAVDEAVAAGDRDRLAELVLHLARVLRAGEDPGELDEQVRRFKLRKRLRIETSDGAFERPRTLLAPDARDGDLLTRFADPRPATVALRYRDDGVLRLLRAAGAERELSAEAIGAYLDGTGRVADPDATVALACYVASAANRAPALRRDLSLDERAWMADALGTPRRASELYWPGDGVVELVGDEPGRLVHPELARRVPAAAEWCGARTADNAALADVAARIASLAERGIPADDGAVFWLDAGLESGALKSAEVRAALSDLRMFADDLGRLRYADELVVEGARRLFGDRRGDWATGARATRLASAMRIARRPGKREVTAFLDQVASQLVVEDGVARDDSDLIQLLPRCLDVLIEEGGRGPARLPIACRDSQGAAIAIVPAAADRVCFAEDDDQKDLTVLLAEGAARDAWRAYLRAYGVGPRELPAPEWIPGAGAGEDDDDDEPARRRDRRDGVDDEPTEEGAGIISRLRRWLTGDDDEDDDRDDDREPPRERDSDGDDEDRGGRRPPPTGSTGSGSRSPRRRDDDDDERPFGQIDQRKWFRSDGQLGSQLESNPAWLADRTRAAEFGLAHAPAALPLPYRYGPQTIFGAFDRGRQSWRRVSLDADWRTGGGIAGRVQLRGKLPSGEAIIPLPLYGRVVDHDGGETTRMVAATEGTVAISRADVVIAIEIELSEAPDFAGARAAGGVPGELLDPTVSDQELPVEVHDFLASLAGETDALVASQLVRSFVRDRYIYDPTYLENAEVAAWLRQRTRRRSNVHIAALHAGRDTDHLGRGVCYELNALVCELMRRCGIPCGVATGWTFDRGFVDEPDHLWAMALVDAGAGPRWLPIDASTTRTGRPLHAANRPPGPWRARDRKAKAPRDPEWTRSEPNRRSAKQLPISDLLRVARYIERTTDTHLGTRAELLAACRALLSDPEAAAALAAVIAKARGEGEGGSE